MCDLVRDLDAFETNFLSLSETRAIRPRNRDPRWSSHRAFPFRRDDSNMRPSWTRSAVATGLNRHSNIVETRGRPRGSSPRRPPVTFSNKETTFSAPQFNSRGQQPQRPAVEWLSVLGNVSADPAPVEQIQTSDTKQTHPSGGSDDEASELQAPCSSGGL
jgi:hypothetical protein